MIALIINACNRIVPSEVHLSVEERISQNKSYVGRSLLYVSLISNTRVLAMVYTAQATNLIMINSQQSGRQYTPEMTELRENLEDALSEMLPCLEENPESFDYAVQNMKNLIGTKDVYKIGDLQ